MAESSTNTNSEPGLFFKNIIQRKVDFVLWVLRFLNIIFTIGYFIPIFWNPHTLYVKALMSYAAVSLLRLHQRVPRVSFTKEFFYDLLMEDSFHYLLYIAIFFSVSPVTLVLQPLFLFSLLHFSSYSLTLLDAMGQNSCWPARFLISLVELLSVNILRLVAYTEIFLMPFTVVLIFMGRASLLVLLFYYKFLCMRYASRRNPYSRLVFSELRWAVERFAAKPQLPNIIRVFLMNMITVTCQLSPTRIFQQE